jgi:uncharacterized protein YjgD (DUF1641 family)
MSNNAPQQDAVETPSEHTEADAVHEAREALESAIAENPDAVVAFLARLDLVNDLLDAADLATSALDDEMVRELARTGSSLAEVADTASDPDTVAGLQTMLQAVGRANREADEPLGLRGFLRTLRDPALRRGVRFLLAVARNLGRKLP